MAILDERLNFREHAVSILKKATGKLYFLYRCSASLDSFSRRLLCSALISSGLEYCCSSWYQSLLEEFKRDLAILQRKMVRFVCSMGPREHVGDGEIHSLGWLPFPRRVDFFKMMHVFKVKKTIAPSYISQNFRLVSQTHSYGLRQSGQNFSLALCPFPPRSFTRSAICLWNSLPNEVKVTDERKAFRKRLIDFLVA